MPFGRYMHKHCSRRLHIAHSPHGRAAKVCTVYQCFICSIWYKLLMQALQLLQPLRWRCVECVIHHERDVCEEQHSGVARPKIWGVKNLRGGAKCLILGE